MRRISLWAMLGCIISLAGCEKKPVSVSTASSPAPAKAEPVPTAAARGPNERFYTVQARLDPGGTFYFYADVKEEAREFVDDLKEVVSHASFPPAASGIASAVLSEVERTGLYGIHDIGMSTLPEGDLNLNKLFVNLPEGRQGLLALLGGPAHEIPALAKAPADTLFFASLEFDVAGLLAFIRGAVKNVGGEAALQSLNQQLQAMNRQLGVSPELMINSLAGNFTLLGTLDPASKLSLPAVPQAPPQTPLPAAPADIDSPHFVLVIDTKNNLLYDWLMMLAQRQGGGSETVSGDFRQFALPLRPNPVWSVAPVIGCDQGHLYLATHADYLAKILAASASGGGLAQSPEFKKCSRNLPTQGNSMVYVSDKFAAEYNEFIQAMMTRTSGPGHPFQVFLRKQFGGSKGMYSISINQPDGILSISRSRHGPRSIFAAIGAAPAAILAAIAVPNFLEAQTRSKVSRVKADQRALATALAAYYIDNNAVPPRNELYRLTTPIAYITRIMDDTFAPSPAPFQYYPVSNNWLIWSPGPDESYDLTPEYVLRVLDTAQTARSPVLIDFTYDPTNGTTSKGDLWRVND